MYMLEPDSYNMQLGREEISKAEDELENNSSKDSSDEEVDSVGSTCSLNTQSSYRRKGKKKREPAYYLPKITTRQELLSLEEKYHLKNIILDYPHNVESAASLGDIDMCFYKI